MGAIYGFPEKDKEDNSNSLDKNTAINSNKKENQQHANDQGQQVLIDDRNTTTNNKSQEREKIKVECFTTLYAFLF